VKETEVAAPVVAWLQEQGWDVYQEVENGNVADIVARRPLAHAPDLIWVIETKTTLSLALLDQAIAWTPLAQLVSVAVPASRNTSRMGNRATNLVLRHFKIGLITVAPYRTGAVTERLAPGLHRARRYEERSWEKALCEEQKTYCPAGSAQGGRWTPFKGTCKRLRGYVEKNPGCLMGEAIEGIEHHYQTKASAVSSLRSLVQEGVVPGVRFERDGRKIRLYSEVTDV